MFESKKAGDCLEEMNTAFFEGWFGNARRIKTFSRNSELPLTYMDREFSTNPDDETVCTSQKISIKKLSLKM